MPCLKGYNDKAISCTATCIISCWNFVHKFLFSKSHGVSSKKFIFCLAVHLLSSYYFCRKSFFLSFFTCFVNWFSFLVPESHIIEAHIIQTILLFFRSTIQTENNASLIITKSSVWYNWSGWCMNNEHIRIKYRLLCIHSLISTVLAKILIKLHAFVCIVQLCTIIIIHLPRYIKK